MKTRLSLLLGCLAWLPACDRQRPGDSPAPSSPIEDTRAAGADPRHAESLVGLPLEKAAALADAASISHRVVEVDGESRPVIRDYRPDRLNFTVEKGTVTKVTKG